MKVLVSWLRELSREASFLLGELLSSVLPFVEVYIPAEEIHNASQWLSEIQRYLEDVQFAVLTLTSENFNSHWVFLEAGYLLKAVGLTNIRLLLVDLAVTDISGPIAQLQATSMNKEGIFRLSHSINQRSLESWNQGMDETELRNAFETHWPKFESQLPQVRSRAPHKTMSDRDVLYEILDLSRGIAQAVGFSKLINSRDTENTPTKPSPVGGERHFPAGQKALTELTQLIEELTSKNEKD
jgi:hypothetical protein